MPPGTPPDKVLEAVKDFAREEFGLKHRYAMVLHTDEPHPHVHVVVKAVSEHGERLNIRKQTLRNWRREFAYHLRARGVSANATERAVRGESRASTLDGIYRAQQRGESRHLRARAEAAEAQLLVADPRIERAKAELIGTRTEVEQGWRAVRDILRSGGRDELASSISRFVDAMPPPRTALEQAAEELIGERQKELSREPFLQGR
jgi:hypothetical protein